MEICKNNLWGTVCDFGWDTADARVVCRQLNFSIAGTIKSLLFNMHFNFGSSSAPVAIPDANFGQGTGRVSMGNVQCAGTEARLADCPVGFTVICHHNNDAGVRCQAKRGECRKVSCLF